ncbi:MAG: IS1595 family transposase [Candidatus Gastranaerophilales bacterium]|nr:IS1595 family transposase [Candidatus Gastranaerophilales bacterium]
MAQSKNTTAYYCKMTDLDSHSELTRRKSVNKKLNKFLQKVNFHPNCSVYISINMDIKEALYKKFKNLIDLRNIFKTDEDCIKFLEELIWGNEPVSPFDENSKVYKCKDGWYKCKNTGKEFNILTGTLFQNTKIPLPIWFEIIFRAYSDKRGLPATMIVRDYGFTYQTAWYMLHKIRNAMGEENCQELSGTVEVDEYFAGGSHKNMHYDKKLEAKQKPNQGKKPLQGFVERNGDAVITVIKDRTDSTLTAGVLRYVKQGSTLNSDDCQSYLKLPPVYNHNFVVHSKGIYVSKDNKDVHTNTIECVWFGIKRIENTYIKLSEKHMQNYANEVCFRYNVRNIGNSANACTWFLQKIQGTNITWKEIRNAKYTQYNRNKARSA